MSLQPWEREAAGGCPGLTQLQQGLGKLPYLHVMYLLLHFARQPQSPRAPLHYIQPFASLSGSAATPHPGGSDFNSEGISESTCPPPGAGGAITHLLRVPSPCRPGLRTTRVKDGTRVCVELQPDYRATGAEGCGQQGGETRRGGGQEGGGTRAAPRQEVLTRKPGAGSGMIHRTP